MNSPLIIAQSNKTLRSVNKQTGAAMVEYAIMLALIAIVAIAAVNLLGKRVNGTFNSIVSSLPVSSTTGGQGGQGGNNGQGGQGGNNGQGGQGGNNGQDGNSGDAGGGHGKND